MELEKYGVTDITSKEKIEIAGGNVPVASYLSPSQINEASGACQSSEFWIIMMSPFLIFWGG